MEIRKEAYKVYLAPKASGAQVARTQSIYAWAFVLIGSPIKPSEVNLEEYGVMGVNFQSRHCHTKHRHRMRSKRSQLSTLVGCRWPELRVCITFCAFGSRSYYTKTWQSRILVSVSFGLDSRGHRTDFCTVSVGNIRIITAVVEMLLPYVTARHLT